ncbi:hypothetical protein GCM10009530_63570 [Microbispora corallina]|uniref:Uncharacterized protein n=1 Tax=Microbispora corallina TaxID=83302 RepID=A0ABQ4GBG8_9ACTN|nr:hypothetical protein [Microbispora corallina]GIH44413.1 hypothetical protein Mco01_74130 [Microbispora corallina]
MTPTPNPVSTVVNPLIDNATMPPVTPASPSFTDQLQGWGTVAAAVLALAIAVAGWIITSAQRKADQTEANRQREEDRADADRRLLEERADADRRLLEERAAADQRLLQERQAADERLQRQLDAQRARDQRDFLIDQLQALIRLFAEYLTEKRMAPYMARFNAQLLVIPDRYASLLRRYTGIAEQRLSAEEANERLRELTRNRNGHQTPPQQIPVEWIYREIADNINELLSEKESRDG